MAINGCVLSWQQNGDTSLHIAAALGRRKITRLLTANDHADVNISNKVC